MKRLIFEIGSADRANQRPGRARRNFSRSPCWSTNPRGLPEQPLSLNSARRRVLKIASVWVSMQGINQQQSNHDRPFVPEEMVNASEPCFAKSFAARTTANLLPKFASASNEQSRPQPRGIGSIRRSYYQRKLAAPRRPSNERKESVAGPPSTELRSGPRWRRCVARSWLRLPVCLPMGAEEGGPSELSTGSKCLILRSVHSGKSKGLIFLGPLDHYAETWARVRRAEPPKVYELLYELFLLAMRTGAYLRHLRRYIFNDLRFLVHMASP